MMKLTPTFNDPRAKRNFRARPPWVLFRCRDLMRHGGVRSLVDFPAGCAMNVNEPLGPTDSNPSENSSPVPAAKRKWWMRVLGVKRRPGRRLTWGLTWWGMFLAVAFFMACGMAAFGEYSMQPAFCESCHIMEPYYQAWHQSTHKNVPCTDCHFEPGVEKTLYGKFQASSQAIKYITNTYGSKPHAEIRDSSCTREGCHDTRILQGKVDWKVQTERGGEVTIHFDHTPHLTLERRGKQLRCVSCHSQIVQGKHIVVTTDTCFLCHFKGLKHGRDDQTIGTCKGCHDPPSQPILLPTGQFNHKTYTDRGVKCENCHADTVRGDGAVPPQVCWNCHNQTAQVEKYGEPTLLHKAHVTDHKVECSGCHVQIEHSLVAGAREETMLGTRFATDAGTCGMCHEQTHNGPRDVPGDRRPGRARHAQPDGTLAGQLHRLSHGQRAGRAHGGRGGPDLRGHAGSVRLLPRRQVQGHARRLEEDARAGHDESRGGAAASQVRGRQGQPRGGGRPEGATARWTTRITISAL